MLKLSNFSHNISDVVIFLALTHVKIEKLSTRSCRHHQQLENIAADIS